MPTARSNAPWSRDGSTVAGKGLSVAIMSGKGFADLSLNVMVEILTKS
jgi:hypothetical protein